MWTIVVRTIIKKKKKRCTDTTEVAEQEQINLSLVHFPSVAGQTGGVTADDDGLDADCVMLGTEKTGMRGRGTAGDYVSCLLF